VIVSQQAIQAALVEIQQRTDEQIETETVAPFVGRVCRKCDTPKDADQFSSTSTGALYSYCRSCKAEMNRVRPRTPYRNRETQYNIDFEAMWSAQDGKCAMCHLPMRRSGQAADSVVVDHDRSCCQGTESCGQCVRGLVHGACNQLIGLAHEDVDVLSGAIVYLQNWKARVPVVSKPTCRHCGAIVIRARPRCCPAMRDERRDRHERKSRQDGKKLDNDRNAERRAAGLCYVCADPIGRSGQCDKCNAHRAEVRRARVGLKPRDASAIGCRSWLTRRRNKALRMLAEFDVLAYESGDAA
jgi:hypothetical protein